MKISAATLRTPQAGDMVPLAATGGSTTAYKAYLQPGTTSVRGLTYETVYNVRAYGAVGNGSTNDAAAIQAALDAAKTANGGVIYFPPGNYYIGSTPLTYQGGGSGVELTIAGDTQAPSTKITASGAAIIFDFIGTDHVTIKDLRIETVTSACQVGILFARKTTASYGSEHKLFNVVISGEFSKANVYAINSEVIEFYGCKFHNTSAASSSYTFFTSTDNDLSVTSSGGTISQSADGVTNSVIHIFGGAITHYGTNGTACGLTGNTVNFALFGTYLYSDYRNISLLPSSVLSYMYGPVNITNATMEGASGAYGIYIGDLTLYNLHVTNSHAPITSLTDWHEIYQANQTSSNGLYRAYIRHNYPNSTNAWSFHTTVQCEFGDVGTLQIRAVGNGNRYYNVTSIDYNAAAGLDYARIATTRAATGEQRAIYGPSAGADSVYYSAIQLKPSDALKTLGASDIGLVAMFTGLGGTQPHGYNITDLLGNQRCYLCYWTGYEYLPISAPRQERYLTALPTSGAYTKGDVVWHRDASLGEVAFWQCTTSGYAYKEIWSGGGTYVTGDRVKGSDGKVYQAGADGGQGEDPVTDSDHTYWTLEYATAAVFSSGPTLS